MSSDEVWVLSGGEVLLSGSAVLWFATLAERAVYAQRLNGVRNPLFEGWAQASSDAARRSRCSGAGTSEFPRDADLSPSLWIDPVSPEEAAVILQRTARNVRALCSREAFASAAKDGGRWRIERAEVVDRAARMAG